MQGEGRISNVKTRLIEVAGVSHTAFLSPSCQVQRILGEEMGRDVSLCIVIYSHSCQGTLCLVMLLGYFH